MENIRRALDSLALYLPGLVMAIFALGSWWLVRSLPTLLNDAPTKAVRQEPDYYLNQFSVQSFNSSGRLIKEISGKRAQHFPDSDTLEISDVVLQGVNPNGKRFNARADRALAKGDGSEMTLMGDVFLTQQASSKNNGLSPIELRSQKLNTMTKEERLFSDVPVEIRRGQDVFTANSMRLNSQTGEYELTGKVRGVIQAAKR
jgi:lipopolysaccharide export system protein LptC